jgi:choline dehydrogenase-like flavoprotein
MCADKTYDAVIIGSGISGALIAHELGRAGKQVLILESGAPLPPDINGYLNRFYATTAKVPEIPYTPELLTPDGKKLVDPRTVNAGRPTVLSLAAKGNPFGDWTDPTKAYLVQVGKLPFASTSERINGGTARHWLGTSFRFLPNDFEMNTRYGQFVDWPVRYDTGPADLRLKSWYDKAEHAIGVSADVKDQEYLGLTFDGPYPMPAIPLSLGDKRIGDGIAGFTHDGVELKVRSTPAARNSRPYQDRRVCAGNTNCIPICPIGAKYDPSVTLAAALRTGNVEIRYRTVAYDVVIGENSRVRQIKYLQYQDDNGPQTGSGAVSAKVYILAAHAIETPRLLLMSRDRRGVANSSGMVGKHLMDHPLYLAWALMPDAPDKRVFPYRGPLSTAGIEDLRDGPFRRNRAAFRIEIGNEGWNFPIGDPATTTLDFINGSNVSQLNDTNPAQALFGTALVKKLNSLFTRQFRLGFLVEQSPETSNRVTLSTKFTDGLGLPRPEITYDLSDYTKRGMAEAKALATAIFNKLGAKEYTREAKNDPSQFEWPVGSKQLIKYYGAGHIVGTYCMGTDRKKSVVNADQRSWDHDNLYLVGSGTFPTVATGNPTLTIAALCLRTADHIVKKVLN